MLHPALLLLALRTSTTASTRVQTTQASQATSEPAIGSYNVHLLLSRHGVSCANMVSHWGRGGVKSFGHRVWSMTDPLLSEAGKVKTMEVAVETDTWLQENGLKIDIVLSSVLNRAMHTAVLQYPGHVVYPVPFIREKGTMSANNTVALLDDQMTALADAETEAKINTHYVEDWPFRTYRDSAGKWEDFVTFLSDVLLPDLVTKRDKQPGDNITIAVVSHSKFMVQSKFFEGLNGDCGSLWFPEGPKSKEKLPRNNQVVHLEYVFTIVPPFSRTKVTPEHILAPFPKCDSVATGIQTFDANGMVPLCIRDIGQRCFLQAGDAAPKTLEKRMLDTKVEVKRLQQTIAWSERQLLKDSAGSRDGQKFKSKRQQHIDESTTKLEGFQKRLSQLSRTTCFSGGFPDVVRDVDEDRFSSEDRLSSEEEHVD